MIYADTVSQSFQPSASPIPSLLSQVSSASPFAIHQLAPLVNDLDNHQNLFSAGVIQSLVQALENILSSPSPSPALLVNLVRLLADLAKSPSAPSFFASYPVVPLLSQLLTLYPPLPPKVSWYEYFFPPAKPKNESSMKEVPAAHPDAVIDYISNSMVVAPSPEQLQAGVAYHAIRCIANLARDPSVHPTLIDAQVLPILIKFLQNVRLGSVEDTEQKELIRCATLAVAAVSKSAAEEVDKIGGVNMLVKLLRQGGDDVVTMYAAGGVRNMAKEGGTKLHRDLVVAGAADALKKALSEGGAQTKVFCIGALEELIMTTHEKRHIIRKRLDVVYGQLGATVREKNQGVQRAILRCLKRIYEGGDVPKSLSSSVVKEVGGLIQGPVARGDVDALKALGAMCGEKDVAKGMVENGVVEVLVRGVEKGKGEYWEQSVAALAKLSEWEELRPQLVSKGALRATLARPCLDGDARWTATMLSNMARDESSCMEIAHSGLNVLLTALTSKDPVANREGARGLYNLSLIGISRTMIPQAGALTPLVKAAGADGDTRRFAIGALAKVSEGYEHGVKLVEAGTVEKLLNAAKEDMSLSKDVAHCLGNLTQNVDVHGTLAKSGAAGWLVDMLSKNGGRSKDAAEVVHYACLGVCNLAYSEGITRKTLRDAGAVPVLTAMSSSGMMPQHVSFAARQALHNLRGIDKPGMLPLEALPKPPTPA